MTLWFYGLGVHYKGGPSFFGTAIMTANFGYVENEVLAWIEEPNNKRNVGTMAKVVAFMDPHGRPGARDLTVVWG